jgi:RNA polymerase sigma-70 factor (ECF subfamily)
VLILRDVLAWPAQQVADLLDTTAASVNSALQRARATLANTQTAAPAARPEGERERRVVEAFMRAWHDCDIPALAQLLRDDATLTMPPQALQFLGRAAVVEFFATMPAEGRLNLIELVAIRANGHPAVAAYLPDSSTGDCRGYGIMVLTVDCDQIASITGFPDPALFPAFDLPTSR